MLTLTKKCRYESSQPSCSSTIEEKDNHRRQSDELQPYTRTTGLDLGRA